MSELQRLRDRVQQLEEAIGINIELPNQLGFTPVESRVLGLLMKRDVVNRDFLHSVLYGDRPESDQPGLKIIEVYICKLRKKLKPMNIKIYSRYKVGYFIDEPAKAAIKDLNRAGPLMNQVSPMVEGRLRGERGRFIHA